MLTRLSKMTTQGKLLLLSGVFAFGMIAFGTIALWTLSTVKVLGPHYQRVVLNKDLLADVLPPPNYIVETYLTAHLMPDVSDREERQSCSSNTTNSRRTTRLARILERNASRR